VAVESVREAMAELVGRHHPELLEADAIAFAGGYDRAKLLVLT
jgi:hypothetical protein